MSHQRLLKTISSHGVRGKISVWMKDWLKGRKWQVGENGVFLQWREVTGGVLLGPVVGARLFKISLNEVEKKVSGDARK